MAGGTVIPGGHCCGWECQAATEVHQQLVGDGVSFNSNASFIRSGIRSGHVVHASNLTGAFQTNMCNNAQQYEGRIYVYFTTLPNANVDLYTISRGGSSSNIGICFQNSDDTLRCGRWNGSSVSFGSTGVVVTTGQWYRLDVKINCSVNPWTCDGYVNGTALARFTVAVAAGGIDDENFGNIGAAATLDMYFDDMLGVTEATGLFGTQWPFGDGTVYLMEPVSDGTHNISAAAFQNSSAIAITILTTDAWTFVDEIPVTTTTDYVAQLTNSGTEYIEIRLRNLGATQAWRFAVLQLFVHQAGTGAGVFDAHVVDGTGDYNVLTVDASRAGSTSLQNWSDWELADDVGLTAARVNNIRVRFGYSTDANPDQFMDGCFIEAEFVGVAAAGQPTMTRWGGIHNMPRTQRQRRGW